jgi:ATP-dependent DNA ligase
VAALPAGEKWAFELKLDGYRCIAVKRGKEVTLFSRHRKVLNWPFPGVVDALASLKDDLVLDAELVVLDPEGRPSFQLLHGAVSASLPTHFYASGQEWRAFGGSALSRRRAVLENLLARCTCAVACLSTIAGSHKG